MKYSSKEAKVDKALDGSDDRVEAPAHSDTPDYSSRAKSTPRWRIWGGFQTLSIIPPRHGGRVNRAIFIDELAEGCALLRLLLSASCRKGGNLPRLPRSEDFLSIPHRDRKAHPAEERRSFFQHHRRIAPLDSYSISSMPRATAMPRFRWIFLGRIHNVHLCTGQ